MLDEKFLTYRIALLADLLDQSPVQIGRTAIMKLCYFLQTLRNVDLGYEFSLYSYGPFDSEVLTDLQRAEGMGVIDSEMLTYTGGYQYQLSTAAEAPAVKRYARKFLDQNRQSIGWVIDTFASRSASELELLSTIVYVDREKKVVSRLGLRDRVKHIKPHFSEIQIENKISFLADKELLPNTKI